VISCLCRLIYAYKSGDNDDDVEPRSLKRQSNRKDIATTFTRILTLDAIPLRIPDEHYTTVGTVVLPHKAFQPVMGIWEVYSLTSFFGTIAKAKTSSPPLHIIFQGDGPNSRWKKRAFSQTIHCFLHTPIPATYEYLGLHKNDLWLLIGAGYRLRAILHAPHGTTNQSENARRL
jgi:hypothetical protein